MLNEIVGTKMEPRYSRGIDRVCSVSMNNDKRVFEIVRYKYVTNVHRYNLFTNIIYAPHWSVGKIFFQFQSGLVTASSLAF